MDAIVVRNCNVQDAPAEHGAKIGEVLGAPYSTTIQVDKNRMEHGWVPVIGPANLGPTWMKTGKQGWVEFAHLAPKGVKSSKILVTVYEDGTPPTAEIVG